MKKDVMLVTGAGQIGMAIARRVGFGKKIILGDKNMKNAETIAKIMSDAGAFITGSTFLADGGATASYYYGPLQPEQ